jgi:hypothetical protein
MRGFTDSLRVELMHDNSNVHITMVQLPGLNTPQFDHCKTNMPYHPQPVPPIFQPEVAADAIVWAADHPKRRETFVGTSAVITILGNKLAPWLGDIYLARTAYSGQQTNQKVNPDDRPDNLFEPLSGDRGAHGQFDGQSYDSSPQLWATKNRGMLAAGAVGVAALIGAALLKK